MISVRSLSKYYGRVKAVENLSCEFPKGKVTTIIGANGSGKTTLMKCILGFIYPSSGDIVIDGESVLRETLYKKKIGYMGQKPSFPENLLVREIISLVKSLREDVSVYDEALISAFGFHTEMEKPFHSLSGGNKQKLNAVIAFLFSPRVILLDEPTAGLDPLASSILKDKITAEKAAGKTILLTSHIIDEIEGLTDELIMLSDGKLRFAYNAGQLREQNGGAPLSALVAELFRKAQATGE